MRPKGEKGFCLSLSVKFSFPDEPVVITGGKSGRGDAGDSMSFDGERTFKKSLSGTL